MIGSSRVAPAVLLAAAALALSARPEARADERGERIATADFEVRLPEGWTKVARAVPASVASSSLVVECAGHVQVLVCTRVASGNEAAEIAKELKESPGLGAAAFVMPMALRGGAVATTFFDEVDVAGEPTAAARVIASARDGGSTSFHGAVRFSGDRMVMVAVIARHGQSADTDPDPAYMKACAQAYRMVREMKLTKR